MSIPEPYVDALAQSLSNKSLELILFPTEQCNFRCTYCYEDFALGRMKKEVVSGIKQLIRRRAIDLTHLHVSWFGGEPLMAKDIVADICETARECAEKSPALCYSGSITTNAYLLNGPTLELLNSRGVKSFQITLDGPKHLHDSTRRRADGRGTFDQVWENLIVMLESDLDFQATLRLHITRDNLQAMPNFVRHLRDTFGKDSRFLFYLRPISKLGGPNDDKLPTLDRDQWDTVINDLRELMQPGKTQPNENDHPVCYAAKPNSYLIRSDGRIGKCTVMLKDSRNTIGHIDASGAMHIDDRKLSPWLRGWEQFDAFSLSCPMQTLSESPQLPVISG